jgi:hypothetical protein
MKKLTTFHVIALCILLATAAFAQNNTLKFDGTNDYILVANNSSLENWDGTIEAWFKPDWMPGSNGQNPCIISMRGNNDHNRYSIHINDNLDKIGLATTGPTGYQTVNYTFTKGQWYHLALVVKWNNSSEFYINGISIGTVSNFININQTGLPLTIGWSNDDAYTKEHFNGMIDEVRIWDEYRTTTEIRQNMYRELPNPSSETKLVAYYKFNETTGITLHDSKGSNNGTLTNMAGNEWTPSPAMFGPKNCLDFDGIDDVVDMGADAALQLTGDLTLECWANYTTFVDWSALIEQGTSTDVGVSNPYNILYLFRLASGNKISLFWEYGDGENVDATSSVSASVSSGEWHHYAVVRNASAKTVTFYIDGEQLGSVISYSNNPTDGSSGVFTIGGEYQTASIPNGYQNFFEGKIDEVRVWNDIRTVSEIRENMYKLLNGSESGLAASYTFDNKLGTTLQDFSGNGIDGTLKNMTNLDWVTSTAYNTWLSTSSTSWNTAANWSGGIPLSGANVAIYNYTNEPDIPASQTFGNLYLGSGITSTLGGNITVNGSLILDKDLDLSGSIITLGSGATLVENSGRLYGSSGSITATCDLNDIISENVAGLGAEITTAENMGTTTITRGHAEQTGSGNAYIQRYYDITPTNNTNLDATFVFHYNTEELGWEPESMLSLFKSTDGGSTWTNKNGTIDANANKVTLANVDSFSRWTVGVEGPDYSGNGTEEYPYLVSSTDDLIVLSYFQDHWGKHFKQVADIAFNSDPLLVDWDDDGSADGSGTEGFSPIGNNINIFTGSYDGDGYSIANLYINRTSEVKVGFFGQLSGVELSNIHLINVDITGDESVGGLAGYLFTDGANISYCTVTGAVKGNYDVGGVIGGDYSSNGVPIIENSSFSGTAEAANSNSQVGGFIGGKLGSSIIRYCSAAGNITADGRNCGGFVGWHSRGEITCCFSTSDVSNTTNYQGRIGGFAGGVAYYNGTSGTVGNCYALGDVSVPNLTSDYNNYGIGGFVGGYSGDEDNEVNNSYACGEVSTGYSNSYVGGFSGNFKTTNSPGSGNFWNIETTGQSTSACSGTSETGVTTAEMKQATTFLDGSWDFALSGNKWAMNQDVNSGYPFLRMEGETPAQIWLASAKSSVWEATGNWSENSTPGASNNVIVPDVSTDPIISNDPSAPALCDKLTIEPDAALTISAGKALTVNDDFVNEGTLTISSSSSVTGSLIINGAITNEGNIFSQRSFPQSSQAWHMLAAPVASGIVTNSFNPGENDAFYAWLEPSPGTWVNYKNTSSSPTFGEVNGGDNFVPGKGYLVAYTGENITKTFTGTLNTGSVNFVLKNSGGLKAWNFITGWNLIGNPYSSGIDWNLATRTQFQDNYAYIYNPNKDGGAGYVDIDGDSENAYIGPHQAFFVLATTSANDQNFTFTNAMQVHDGVFLKNSNAVSGIALRLSNDQYYDETTIRIRENALYLRDRQDAVKMFSFDAQVPQLYSISEDEIPLSVNSLPDVSPEKAIALGMQLPSDGQFTLSLQQFHEFMASSGIYLEDRLSGAIHKLCNAAYSFNAEAGEITDRFYLHFGIVGIAEQNPAIQIPIWQQGRHICISGTGDYDQILLFDIRGRLLLQKPTNGEALHQIQAPLTSGIYIVRLVSSKHSVYQKIFIK